MRTSTSPETARPDAAGGTAATLEARDISAWFGDHHVLDRVSLTMEAGRSPLSSVRRDAASPPSCGSSTACTNSSPRPPWPARYCSTGSDIYDPARKLTEARRQHRHGLPEAESLPGHVDLRQRPGRAEAHRYPGRPGRQGSDRRRLPGQGGPVERGGATGCARPGARCRADSSSACASPASLAIQPTRAADGRAVLGPRSRPRRVGSRRPSRNCAPRSPS